MRVLRLHKKGDATVGPYMGGYYLKSAIRFKMPYPETEMPPLMAEQWWKREDSTDWKCFHCGFISKGQLMEQTWIAECPRTELVEYEVAPVHVIVLASQVLFDLRFAERVQAHPLTVEAPQARKTAIEYRNETYPLLDLGFTQEYEADPIPPTPPSVPVALAGMYADYERMKRVSDAVTQIARRSGYTVTLPQDALQRDTR